MGNIKKYVAIIMNRNYMNSSSCICNPINVAVGTIDQETGIFKDKNGNEYLSMCDPTFLYSECPYSYFNAVGLSDLNNLMEFDGQLKDAISVYYERCKNLFYYITVDSEGKVATLGLNHDSMHNAIEDYNNKKSQNSSCPDVPAKTNDNLDGYDDYSNLMYSIMMGIINDKFSYEELLELKDELAYHQEGYEAALLSIDMKLESMRNDSSFNSNIEDSLKKGAESKPHLQLVNKKPNPKVTKKVIPDDFIDINDVYSKVVKTLIAQDEPARRLIVEISKMYSDNEENDGILLTGSTGVGKTKLMSLIAKYLDKPFLAVDSTQLTIPGYIGLSIEQVLWNLYVACGKDKKKAESAIVFFDEIDKKGSKNKSDISGQGVLNVLLKFLDGTTYVACQDPQHQGDSNSVHINTSNMLVVVGGAFADVYKNLSTKRNVGFASESNENNGQQNQPTLDDFVTKAMMTEEFMARMPIVIHLNDLTQESMKRILNESNESPIKREEKRFDKVGVKLKVTDGYLDAISKRAFELKTGARGLKSIIADTTWKPFDEVSCNIGVYDEVILDADDEKGSNKDEISYQLVKKRNVSSLSGNNIDKE